MENLLLFIRKKSQVKKEIMNKKQRNRKRVNQIKRNYLLNRRYRSTIKTFLKLIINKEKNYLNCENKDEKDVGKKELKKIASFLYSLLDKAARKNIIHRNKAARKKSKIGKMVFWKQ